MSMLAAAISDVLAEGASPAAVACWWNAPRRELAGLSPHAALAATPAAGPQILAIARSDVAAGAAADAHAELLEQRHSSRGAS
jgi:hypothetical protein